MDAGANNAAALSVMYSLGVVIFGGFSPLVVTWLIQVTGNVMMPAWYLMVAIGVTLFALTRFPEDTKARALSLQQSPQPS
jgi:MHS family proline/betaine transporter-like MFS transporter